MVWASIMWAGGKIMERKWFGPSLFGRGNNAEEMVWASVIWAITITTSTIITTTITFSINITRRVLAGGEEIVDGNGLGLHYLGGGENNGEKVVWASIIWAGK